MNQYTAHDIQAFLETYSANITHIVVAHTNFRPFDKTQRQIDRMAEQAKKDFTYALNCFDKLLFPNETNKPKRNPLLYKPLRFVTIENAKENLGREQTIHFNIALGNLPQHSMCPFALGALFQRAWVDIAKQADDVMTYRVSDYPREKTTWIGYSLKEAQQQKDKAWRFDGTWDVTNCWIPHAALNTD